MALINRLLSFAHTILADGSYGSRSCDAETKKATEKLGVNGGFQMPLHYPRYTKSDYEKMEEWKLDMLLLEYGLSFRGNLDEKRKFAMGAFLWPDQY